MTFDATFAARLRQTAAIGPAAIVVGVLFAAVLTWNHVTQGATDSTTHFADATNGAAVARGAVVYANNCAACHGARLQGQSGWQVIAADGILRAPPQNDSGHTWMHSDEELFDIVKYGSAYYLPPGLTSPMPVFGGRLSDAQIEDVLAFIKSHWSIGFRAYQALLNPGDAGMPEAAAAGHWVLPPDCRFELLRPRGTTAAKNGRA